MCASMLFRTGAIVIVRQVHAVPEVRGDQEVREVQAVRQDPLLLEVRADLARLALPRDPWVQSHLSDPRAQPDLAHRPHLADLAGPLGLPDP